MVCRQRRWCWLGVYKPVFHEEFFDEIFLLQVISPRYFVDVDAKATFGGREAGGAVFLLQGGGNLRLARVALEQYKQIVDV